MNIEKLIKALPKDSQGEETIKNLYPKEYNLYKAKEWFENEILDKLEKKVDRIKYPNWVFYFIGDKCFFELEYQDKKNRWFGVRYFQFWEVLENDFGFNYIETERFIKDKVEQHFKTKVEARPTLQRPRYLGRVDEHFKNF